MSAQALGQRLLRLTLPEPGTIDQNEAALAGVVGLNCFSAMIVCYSPVVTSIECPSARVTIAFLMSGLCPGRPRKRLLLPF